MRIIEWRDNVCLTFMRETLNIKLLKSQNGIFRNLRHVAVSEKAPNLS